MTLESWASGVARPVMAQVPGSWLYFVSFILIGTFVIFNLFVGVIVNNVEQANREAELENAEASQDRSAKELAALRRDVRELKEMLQHNSDRAL